LEEQNKIDKRKIPIKKIAVAFAWVLYITSLFLPCIIFEYIVESKILLGRHILFTGWLAILFGVIGWYANPFFWLATFVYLQSKANQTVNLLAALLATLAFIIALYSLSTEEVWFDDYTRKVIGFGIGYYFWLASITILLVTILIDLKTLFYKKESNK